MPITESSNLEFSQPVIPAGAIGDNRQSHPVLDLDRADRWTVSHRLQDLGLVCNCQGDRPLRVEVWTPLEALHLWSVVQSTTQPKHALAAHLERCWQRRISR